MRRREFVPKTSTRTRSAGGAAAPARASERGEMKSAPGHNLVGPDCWVTPASATSGSTGGGSRLPFPRPRAHAKIVAGHLARTDALSAGGSLAGHHHEYEPLRKVREDREAGPSEVCSESPAAR
jgi:hypothetical protein